MIFLFKESLTCLSKTFLFESKIVSHFDNTRVAILDKIKESALLPTLQKKTKGFLILMKILFNQDSRLREVFRARVESLLLLFD